MTKPTLQPVHASILLRLEEKHFPFHWVECKYRKDVFTITIIGFDGNSIEFTKSEIDECRYPEWASSIIKEVQPSAQNIINHINM